MRTYRWICPTVAMLLLASSAAWSQKKETLVAAPSVAILPLVVAPAKPGQIPNGEKPTGASDKQGYNVPIYFDPTENGTDVSVPTLEYKLTAKGEFTLGGVPFPLEVTDVKVDRFLSGKNAEYHLKFYWPGGFLASGKIGIRTNLEKKTVFEKEFDHSSAYKSGKQPAEDFEEVVLYEDEISRWGKNTPFKFCVEEYVLDLRRSLCSKDLILVDGTNGVEVHASTQKYPVEVRFNNAPVPGVGSIPVKYGEITYYNARTADGAEFQMDLRPITFKVLDMTQSNDGNFINVTAEGGIPQGENIVEQNDGWVAKISRNRPYIYFTTENHIQLRQDFKFSKKIPTEDMRAYLSHGTTTSSYLSSVPMHGYLPYKAKVSSTENSATNTAPQLFDWEFSQPERGQLNRSHVSLLYDTKESYIGSYRSYKGYALEASTRLTTQTTPTGTLILGEILATGWFESIFGAENYIFSKQRWGLSARYVTSLTSPNDPANNAPMTFRSFDAQIRYRLTPGVWNQIETFGLLIPYQNVNYENAAGSMTGLGAFWVKPFPSIIDKFLNHVKFLRYPKIIDAEFQYFFLPGSGITLATNMNAVIHGKMFLKPTFFAEGAAGYKQFGYSQVGTFVLNLTSFYASVGVGWDF